MKKPGKSSDADAAKRKVLLASAIRNVLAGDLEILARMTRRSSRTPSEAQVHTARIALRRSAALLSFFGGDLGTPNADKLSEGLRSLTRMLGEARDATVWIKLLESKKIRRAMAGTAGWKNFLAKERQREKTAYAKLAGVWSQARWCKGLDAFQKFLRTELPRSKSQQGAADACAAFLKQQFARLPATAAKLPENSEAMHKLRRRMRRVRYVAEAFEPFLKSKPRRRARRLHDIESAVGRLHDIDVALVRLAKDSRVPASHLAAVFKRRREMLRRKISKAWKQSQTVFPSLWKWRRIPDRRSHFGAKFRGARRTNFFREVG